MTTESVHKSGASSTLADVIEAATRGDRYELQIAAQGQSATLRGDAARAVVGLLRALVSGGTVEVQTLPAMLTTGQAADLLGVSRPTVVALVQDGRLPATLVGTHRRLRLSDVLAYREQQSTARRRALQEITHISEELGLYGE
jgi:excisionase family DNA binding protein